MAHKSQSRPVSGLGFQVKVLKSFSDVPSLRAFQVCSTQSNTPNQVPAGVLLSNGARVISQVRRWGLPHEAGSPVGWIEPETAQYLKST